MSKHSKSAADNRANQLNPHHPAYYTSRGATPGEAAQRAQQAPSEPSQNTEGAPVAAPPPADNSGKSK